jgi:hypothetical protein
MTTFENRLYGRVKGTKQDEIDFEKWYHLRFSELGSLIWTAAILVLGDNPLSEYRGES